MEPWQMGKLLFQKDPSVISMHVRKVFMPPQNHARSTLHHRFCPYGFVLKPVGPETPVFGELGMVLFLKCRFRETMPDEFSMVDFPPSGSY